MALFAAITCTHNYDKKCGNFHFKCCDKVYSCHRCHNENDLCSAQGNPQVDSIQCLECNTIQEPSNSCISCGIVFSRSFCQICKIWTAKDIQHCEKCGICRVGTTLFHCDRCNLCYPRATHTCAFSSVSATDTCPVCREKLHDSQTPLQVAKCGHVYHCTCLNNLIRWGHNCSLCRKVLVDMSEYWNQLRVDIAVQPISNEILEKLPRTVSILCNECDVVSENVPFHYLGLECPVCRGFNTVISS